MRMYDLILKKRNGGRLTKEEIDFFVKGYTENAIPDYQAAALLMAVYFNKMDYDETLNLTLAMANSGETLDLSLINGIKADKHSTGGVGDKTSLVLAPMVAALGVKMAKMSGRGLGHTGGTIDKLESFKGFSTALSKEQFINNVNEIGFAITGQTGNLAPADKKLYLLRDVTATVDNISLIASSIMSKKLAAGADVIVLDVKTGSGAFMKNEKEAKELAATMVNIGKGAKKETIAVISEMEQPLGNAVGNALEVIEAIETLKGNGPKDLYDLCIVLGTYILIAAKKADNKKQAEEMLTEVIKNKKALDKFAEFVRAQGGDDSCIYDTQSLINVEQIFELKSEKSGYVSGIQSEEVGLAVMTLGGGRETKESTIDLSVGIIINKKVGDYVDCGDTLVTIYSNSEEKTKEAARQLLAAYSFSSEKPEKSELIKGIIS